MATFTITQTGSTEEQAEGAALGIVSDILSIDGVGEPDVVVEESGGTFLAVLTIIIPDDIELDDVQREKLSRYTNLDDKSEELSEDFEEAENGETIDPVAEIVGAVAVAKMQEGEVVNDTVVDESQVGGNEGPEKDLTVDENNIGEMVAESAPEMVTATTAMEQAKEQDEKPQPQNDKKAKQDIEPEIA